MEFYNDLHYPKLLRDLVYVYTVLREQLGAHWLDRRAFLDLWSQRQDWA